MTIIPNINDTTTIPAIDLLLLLLSLHIPADPELLFGTVVVVVVDDDTVGHGICSARIVISTDSVNIPCTCDTLHFK